MGRKKNSSSLTPLELEIMQALWSIGPSSVQIVKDRLGGDPGLAYTTVQTMLNVLNRKGHVKRILHGRAYEYKPLVSKDKALSAALRDVVAKMFGGSAEELVMSLIQDRQIDPERIAELSKKLHEQEARL